MFPNDITFYPAISCEAEPQAAMCGILRYKRHNIPPTLVTEDSDMAFLPRLPLDTVIARFPKCATVRSY